MEITFRGGPKAGEILNVPVLPDAFEFPVYTTNGAINQTIRYERVKKTTNYEFTEMKKSREVVEAPPQKSVVIKRAKIVVKKPDAPKEEIVKGHMEYDSVKGRYVIKKDK